MKSFLMTTAMTPMIFRQAEGEGAGGGSDVALRTVPRHLIKSLLWRPALSGSLVPSMG